MTDDLRARVEALLALFDGGPDTPVRTVWEGPQVPALGIHPTECWSIPADDLRPVLHDLRTALDGRTP